MDHALLIRKWCHRIWVSMKNLLLLANPGDQIVLEISYDSERVSTKTSLVIQIANCYRKEFFQIECVKSVNHDYFL